ncbi:helix-turn-helix domain-containing protein [Microbacterium festucae]|uniref:helix-turn-helix domain-containing protein n=1 Tax=Microbacterium festucae TaxID=2977531 RepID=UPI0036F3B720
MARPERKTPAELTPSWPDGASADPDAEVARLFAVAVNAVLADRSVRALARDSGVHESTLRTILAGSAWPDLRTISRLERATGVPLFPR